MHAYNLLILWHHHGCNRENTRSIFGFERELWPRQHWEIHRAEEIEPESEDNGSDWRLEWGIEHILSGKWRFFAQQTTINISNNLVRSHRVTRIEWNSPRMSFNSARFTILMESTSIGSIRPDAMETSKSIRPISFYCWKNCIASKRF